jgi:hypothetical protein
VHLLVGQSLPSVLSVPCLRYPSTSEREGFVTLVNCVPPRRTNTPRTHLYQE